MTSSSSSSTSSGSAVHLVVICHGLWGEPQHTRFLARTLANRWNGSLSPQSAVDQQESESHHNDDRKKKSNSKKSAKEEKAKARAFKKEEELLEAQHVDLSLNHDEDSKGNGNGNAAVRLVVLNTSSNSSVNTYDGIDWCGERLVKEVSNWREKDGMIR